MADLDALFDADIDNVFLADFGEDVSVTGDDVPKRVIFQSAIEVLSDEGTLDIVSNGILCKAADFKRNDVFVRAKDQRTWSLGRVLERSPDGRLNTYEVTPNADV